MSYISESGALQKPLVLASTGTVDQLLVYVHFAVLQRNYPTRADAALVKNIPYTGLTFLECCRVAASMNEI